MTDRNSEGVSIEMLPSHAWKVYGYAPKKDYAPKYRDAHGEYLYSRENVEHTLLPTMCESCHTMFDHKGNCYGCPPF